MAAFELNTSRGCAESDDLLDSRRLREEPIIAHKIYDSRRAQDCLTHSELGPSRAATPTFVDSVCVDVGEVIVPPADAVSVDISDLTLSRIAVASKKKSPFKKGYWDIEVKYVFDYLLKFCGADGEVVLEEVRATSLYTKKITLFGSKEAEHVVGTDLPFAKGITLNSEPYVWAEGKAIALSAEIRYGQCQKSGGRRPVGVGVTIGLFSITQVFRVVNLLVESRGFDIPRECDDMCPTNPCEFFDALDFPMDIFAPPQLPEFSSGKSSNIPRLVSIT